MEMDENIVGLHGSPGMNSLLCLDREADAGSQRWRRMRGIWASFAQGETFVGVHLAAYTIGRCHRLAMNDDGDELRVEKPGSKRQADNHRGTIEP